MPDSIYLNGLDTFAMPENATLIEQSVYKLRNAIMRGEIRPGQKLIEAALCRALDISRASLREALRALEAEKLIELVPNRGPSVAKLRFHDVEEIHEVWALLTSEAVADFTRLAKPKDIEALEFALRKLNENNRASTPLGQLAAINAFFGTVLNGCGNSVLKNMVISLVARVNFLRAQALLHEGWGTLFAEEIAEILSCIKAKDSDAARVAARTHIATACASAKKLAVEFDLGSAIPSEDTDSSLSAARGRRRRTAETA